MFLWRPSRIHSLRSTLTNETPLIELIHTRNLHIVIKSFEVSPFQMTPEHSSRKCFPWRPSWTRSPCSRQKNQNPLLALSDPQNRNIDTKNINLRLLEMLLDHFQKGGNSRRPSWILPECPTDSARHSADPESAEKTPTEPTKTCSTHKKSGLSPIYIEVSPGLLQILSFSIIDD